MKLYSTNSTYGYCYISQFLSFIPSPLLAPLPFPLLLAAGWWMVDAGGVIGWAPASFLVPVDEEDLSEEAKENEQIVGWEKGGWGNRANSTKLFKGLCIS